MSTKNEAAILGEQIIHKSGELAAVACDVGMGNASPAALGRRHSELRELVADLVALEPEVGRLAATWELQAAGEGAPEFTHAHRETLRTCAKMLREIVEKP